MTNQTEEEDKHWILNLTYEEILVMPTEEIVKLKLQCDSILNRIKCQVQEAEQRAATHGEYADPDWYRRAKVSVRSYGVASQRYQMALGQNKKLQKTPKAIADIEFRRWRIASQAMSALIPLAWNAENISDLELAEMAVTHADDLLRELERRKYQPCDQKEEGGNEFE